MRNNRSVSLLSGAICLLGLLGCDAAPAETGDEQEVTSVKQGLNVSYWSAYHGGGGGSAFASSFSMKLKEVGMICGTYVDWVFFKGEQSFVMGPYGGYWDGQRGGDACGGNGNDLIVGVKGRTGDWVDRLTFVCRRPDGTTYDLTTCGTSTGGEYFEEICTTGTSMVSVAGRESQYGLEGIQIGCGWSDFSH